MSLQLLAKQMEAKGRGGDSLLVHMTPGEVEGLQKLAESMGESLTVNPETGLVEAFKLKELFPVLAGAALTVGTGGAAAPWMVGLGVGGFEAMRTGDIGRGLTAGLGAAGGAGLAGGLMTAGNAAASQAATAANPTVMGPMPGAATGAEALKAGVSGLGNEAGRSAFMQGVGGMGGLAKTAGMAAAPMLAPEERRMAEAPVDDEMYYTEYTPVQSGKRSDTSTEVNQLAGRYAPMESIKAEDYMKRRNRQFSAAQGGLLSYAEGGETAADAAATADAPSASELALSYLMGERSSSAGLPALAAQAPASPASNIGVGGDNMYAFDPATGTFLRNPYVAGANSPAVNNLVGTSFANSGGGYEPVGPNPDFRGDPNTYSNGLTTALFGGQAPAPVVNRTGMDDPSNESRGAVDTGGGYDYSGIDSSSYDSYGGESGGIGASHSDYGDSGYDGSWKQGGLLGLAKGGMASGGFVVPADVVSALGNGSTDAGLRSLNAMLGKVKPIKGKGDGLSDSIKTNIDGKQPARVADGEAYIDPKTVKRLGGAKKLYAMMDKVRAQAHGKTSQQRKVNPAKVMA